MARRCYIFAIFILLNVNGCTSAFQSAVDGRRQLLSAGRLIPPAWGAGRSYSHGTPFVSDAARNAQREKCAPPIRRASPCTALFARRVSDEEMAQRKEQLRELLCATKAEIDQLVAKDPKILMRTEIVGAYSPNLALLQERFGISQKKASQLCLTSARLLTLSLETLVGRIDWLQARLKLSKTQFKTILTRAPGTLALSIDGNLRPKLDNVQSALEMSDKELGKMVARAPDLLKYNFSTEELAARLSFLQNLLGIENNDIASLRKAIVRLPDVLFYPKDRMLKTQHWISERLGLSDARIAQMCTNSPQILVSKTKTLEEKIDRAQAAVSLSDEEVGELFGKFPALFGYCPENNIKPKLRFLRMTFDLNDDALRELLLRMPGLFSSSEETIAKKLKFYAKLIGEEAAKKLVVERPYLLNNFSVENRLGPRLDEVRKSGEKVKWDETMINRLAVRSDALWEKYGLGDAK